MRGTIGKEDSGRDTNLTDNRPFQFSSVQFS
jgi:hypothetical protein